VQPVVLETINVFGIGRAMVGGSRITAGFTPGEQRRLLHDNAKRVYRLM